MEDPKSLASEAERLMDANRPGEAVPLLRRAAESEIPANLLDVVLTNLWIAEREEQFEFRRRLSQRFPDSLERRLREVLALAAGQRSHFALRLASELLNGRDWGFKDEFLIRQARFRAAVQDPDPRAVVEDFRAMARIAEEWPIAWKLIGGSMKSLAAADKPGLAPALDELAADGRFAGPTAEFLRAKAEELRRLVAATAAVRGQADGTGSAADPETE